MARALHLPSTIVVDRLRWLPRVLPERAGLYQGRGTPWPRCLRWVRQDQGGELGGVKGGDEDEDYSGKDDSNDDGGNNKGSNSSGDGKGGSSRGGNDGRSIGGKMPLA
jgi:hypothetical protein